MAYYFGRSERIVTAILVLLGLTAFALYALSLKEDKAVGLSSSREVINHSVDTQADSLQVNKHYVGPPAHLRRDKGHKFTTKQVLDLNKVDSVTLTKVPGIGPAFARRILALRERLGGYYTVMQLQEVYGMDADKYYALKGWFRIGTKPRQYPLTELKADELPKHLYLSWEQVRTMNKLLYRYGRISSWRQLMREPAFTRDDSIRLSPYFVEVDSLAQKVGQKTAEDLVVE